MKFIKQLLILVCLPLIMSGCDQKNSSEDIIKIAAPVEHEIIEKHSSLDQETLLNQGIINLKADNVEKAIEILENYTTYYPHNSVGQFYLGKAYLNNMRYEDAIKTFRKTLMLDESETQAFLYIGQAYEKMGQRKSAIKYLYKYLIAESGSLDTKKISGEINDLAEPVIGKDIIGRVFVTNEVIKEKNLALKPMTCFESAVPEIYGSLEIIDAPANTEIEVKWRFLLKNDKKMEINSHFFTVQGTKNALALIKKPVPNWIPGEYELEILVDGEKNTNLNFYIF
ncbi:MAG TPA: tetratricopeptide repeat protein [Candidatus Gastranaerophilales bacterium]|nr:tetratricopeptide repeat protein [Candidatus Gastranaerophilales bacterium]